MEKSTIAQVLVSLDPAEIKRAASNALSVVQAQFVQDELLGPTNRVMIAHDLGGAHF